MVRNSDTTPVVRETTGRHIQKMWRNGGIKQVVKKCVRGKNLLIFKKLHAQMHKCKKLKKFWMCKQTASPIKRIKCYIFNSSLGNKYGIKIQNSIKKQGGLIV
jgi:hypothetical protein